MYRNHTLMVFEAMHSNLRDTVKKYGSGIGINIASIQLYAKIRKKNENSLSNE